MLHEALGPNVTRELIAHGVDGTVFRVGGSVIKEYYPHITFEQVLNYEAVTNRAAQYLDDEGYTTKGVVAFKPFDMRFIVAPVTLSSFDSERNVARSIALYIPGPRLADFLKDGQPISLNGEVRELGSDEEKLFFQSLAFQNNEKGRGFEKHREFQRLAKFSEDINRKLGIDGVKVSPADVKLRLSTGGELIYVVTDLAPSITLISLNKRKNESR